MNFWRLLCIGLLCTLTISSAYVKAETAPTESECRPHIEKALNTIKSDVKEPDSAEISVDIDDSKEKVNDEQVTISIDDDDDNDDDTNSQEENADTSNEEKNDEDNSSETTNENSNEIDVEADDDDNDGPSTEDQQSGEQTEQNSKEDSKEEVESDSNDNEQSVEDQDSKENDAEDDSEEQSEQDGKDGQSEEEGAKQVDADSQENTDGVEESKEDVDTSKEEISQNNDLDEDKSEEESQQDEKNGQSEEDEEEKEEKEIHGEADSHENENANDDNDDSQEKSSEDEESHEISAKSYPVDDLLLESEIPENLRDRSHIDEILRINEDSIPQNEALEKVADNTLKELKRIYENAIKPLETLYKYRDLSNRHFGDSEIFSKPLVLLMGPWSGGKSSIINYLTGNEYTDFSLKTGAEPSHPYFNILMHGETEQVLDGTQLAADWTFSGLQKFGQGLQDRLRGLKLPSKLLEKVNIVEIPGILEVRKQVSRIFPFNDACQWFIDRADIIFLVYDPSKLDVGPETEAILDQLKGREYQTRILLNKADQVHPEELLRVQGALIWNISPLMSSQQPPIMYTVSLWSHPFEDNTPIRLLQAQEKALLQDLAQAIEHRIENKIASARRFAVRVRNHAKMVDCYLTTYYNHKTLFGNKKKISSEIVAHPQNYHIYEGLSTLTNISRYDLPDPEVYRDFFQLNPLYEFKKLSETCTYFRGCPINKLDVAIAYDLPELVNRYKRAVGQALNTLELSNANNDSSTNRR